MLSLGVLFSGIGLMLVLFNTVNMSFVKNQSKDKRQAIAGFVVLTLGIVLLIVSIGKMMA
jgi:uncharacterized membrane protein